MSVGLVNVLYIFKIGLHSKCRIILFQVLQYQLKRQLQLQLLPSAQKTRKALPDTKHMSTAPRAGPAQCRQQQLHCNAQLGAFEKRLILR